MGAVLDEWGRSVVGSEGRLVRGWLCLGGVDGGWTTRGGVEGHDFRTGSFFRMIEGGLG